MKPISIPMQILVLIPLLWLSFSLAAPMELQHADTDAVKSLLAAPESTTLSSSQVSTIKNGLTALSDVLNGPKIECDNKGIITDTKGINHEISVLSLEKLNTLFSYLASQKHIPFAYPQDGCYARAHEMARLLEDKGVISAKVFLQTKDESAGLRVETKNAEAGHVEWWYHVAPVVNVETKNGPESYVIDPSIFDRPVPLKEWISIQVQHYKPEAKFFFTSRFHLLPYHADRDMNAYAEEDIQSTIDTNKKYKEYLDKKAAKK